MVYGEGEGRSWDLVLVLLWVINFEYIGFTQDMMVFIGNPCFK